MKYANSTYRVGTALALAVAVAVAVAAGPARAAVVLLGADYFATVQPTLFPPLGGLNPLAGLSIGPGNTDTIVHRQSDCSLDLHTAGSHCTIPIELMALSLVSTVDSRVRLRESPTLASTGAMTMTSDGGGTGGTFNSFFDVFFELSFDGGGTFNPRGPLHLTSSDTGWSTIENGLLVNGLVGDQIANRHTNKGPDDVDFYLPGVVAEQHPDGSVHSAVHAAPEPSSVALLGLGLAAMAGIGGRGARRKGVRSD